MKKTAVVVFNLGGPDSLAAVQLFLYNLFSDRDIFKIPYGQKIFAYFISRFRTPKIKKRYALIGGKSPINEWTEKQRALLQKKLNIDVFTAMRYSKPTIRETAEILKNKNYERIVLLPLYPHFSVTTTGSSFNEWNRVYTPLENQEVIVIHDFYDHEKYIEAINERIDEALLEFPEAIRKEVQLVFSAHGTPISLVKKGDPYSIHIQKTVELVLKKHSQFHEHRLAYQSKVGPISWLGPSIQETIRDLAKKEKKHLLIIPISFVSDHIETLYELDIRYRKIANEVGIENYIVMKGLNDSPIFIEALCDIVKIRIS